MFNVLVSASGTAWETDQLMRMDADRFKEYSSGHEAALISLEKPSTLKALEDVSTLLMYERGAEGPNPDIVRYGRLRDIRINVKQLAFRFDEQGQLSRSIVEEFSDRLGLDRFEHSRTHWAIKDGDIPTAMLAEMVMSNISQAKITPFISYAREDGEIARRVFHDLTSAGCEPWLDSEKLRGGQNWEIAIRDAIRSSTYFLALISKHSVNKRGFVQKELAHALDILDEFPPDQIFVIPVRLDSSSPKHERLRRLHWIDLFPNYQEGLQRVIASLGMPSTGETSNTGPQQPKSQVDTLDEIQRLIRARALRGKGVSPHFLHKHASKSSWVIG
jgi:CRP-like cAMP-binding protein